MTRDSLAEKSGLSVMSIRRYESDERQPRVDQLEQIANALDVTSTYLIGCQSESDMQLHVALKHRDVQTLEKLLNYPEGYLAAIDGEQIKLVADLDSWAELSHGEMKRDFNQCIEQEKSRTEQTKMFRTEQINRAISVMQELNDYGLRVAVERIEELAEIMRYRRVEKKQAAPGAADTESGENEKDH